MLIYIKEYFNISLYIYHQFGYNKYETKMESTSQYAKDSRREAGGYKGEGQGSQQAEQAQFEK